MTDSPLTGNTERRAWILGGLLAAGMAVAALIAGGALVRSRSPERTVTVKGLAERSYPADFVNWPIVFKFSAPDLPSLLGRIEKGRGAVRRFLELHQVPASAVSDRPPSIQDIQAELFSQPAADRQERYIATITVMVHTPAVDRVLEAMKNMDTLLADNIALAGNNYEQRPEFLFTRLNEIKPAMLEEANHNARSAAETFARDSGSRLGTIRKAQQGLFTVEDRDGSTPEEKIIRVVSTVEYFLE
jgi:uncharacterized protein